MKEENKKINIKISGIPKEDEDVVISDLSTTYLQKADCCSSEDYNELLIKAEDGGGCLFYVIKTDRWAFDDIDEVIDVLNDFKNRLNLNNGEKEC